MKAKNDKYVGAPMIEGRGFSEEVSRIVSTARLSLLTLKIGKAGDTDVMLSDLKKILLDCAEPKRSAKGIIGQVNAAMVCRDDFMRSRLCKLFVYH